MTKPPSTRHTVMPMSCAKPISVSSVQPLRSIVSGSARKVLLTKPLKVTAAQTATKSTKNADAEHDARARRDRGQRTHRRVTS